MHASDALSRAMVLCTKRTRLAGTAYGTPPSNTDCVSYLKSRAWLPFDRIVAQSDDHTNALMSSS